MIAGAALAALVPHAGAMCLLDRVLRWDAAGIQCEALSHLLADNPLRHGGRLHALCGIEYAMQAAALHGALLDDGRRQPAGRIATMRGVVMHTDRLDQPGPLLITATLVHREAGGLLYSFAVAASAGPVLVEGRAAIALPKEDA